MGHGLGDPYETGSPPEGLSARLARGAGWMVGARLADRCLGVVSLAVLARLLLPADFGLVAYAIQVIAILELFTMVNTDAALIRGQRLERAHYDTAWTLNVLRGVLLSAMVYALAAPAAAFFRAPEVAPIMRWLALIPVLAALDNVGTVEFRKKLTFSREFYFLFCARLLGVALTMGLAFAWRDYWALIGGAIGQRTIRVVLSYIVHPFRPRPTLARFGEIFGFAKWLILQQQLHGLAERAPGFAIGRFAGADAMAFFITAQELSNLATSEVRAPIRRALFPGFALIASRPDTLVHGYLQSLGVIVFLCLPLPIGIGLLAVDVVPLLLGEKWLAVVPLVQAFAVFGVVTTFGTNSHLVYMVIGRTSLTARLSALRLAIVVPGLLFAVPYAGAGGAVLAITAAALVTLAVDYRLVLSVLPVRPMDIAAQLWRPAAASAAMAAGVVSVQQLIRPVVEPTGPLAMIAIAVAVGAATYLGTVWLLWRMAGRPSGAEQTLLDALGRWWPRRAGAAV